MSYFTKIVKWFYIQEKALEAVTGSLGNVLGDSLPIPESTGGVIPELPKSMF